MHADGRIELAHTRLCIDVMEWSATLAETDWHSPIQLWRCAPHDQRESWDIVSSQALVTQKAHWRD